MALDLKSIAVFFAVAIFLNLGLFLAVDFGADINCPYIDEEFNSTYRVEQGLNETQEIEADAKILINIALNRCSGIPAWLFWLVEAPLIIILFYILRGVILGLT